MLRTLLTLLAATLLAAAPAQAQHSVDELLAADRAFAAAAADAPTALDGVAAMFDAEIVMPAGPAHAIGRDAALAALRAVPAWREGHARWTPIRGGVSADGTQGFTFGYLSVSGGDPARRERKYLSYWVRRPEGWRVVAWRQAPRPAGEVSTALLPASPPGRAGDRDEGTNRAGLAAAEQAFSDRAQQIGLRAAFREYGRDDAANMGAGAGFTIGAEAISQAVAPEEATSPVRWSTERSFVAASGDLGVSIGTIHRNGIVPAGEPANFPFFTVWRRDAPDAPWRYIAE